LKTITLKHGKRDKISYLTYHKDLRVEKSNMIKDIINYA